MNMNPQSNVFENKTCSRCGVETNYSDNLHCRQILIGEVKNLLSRWDDKGAKKLVLDSKGDKSWENWKHRYNF